MPTPLGPEIWHTPTEYGAWVIRNGRTPTHPDFEGSTMIAYNDVFLSDADIDATLAWLNAFPRPTTGPEMYGDYCSHCHGADGAGVVGVGPDIRPETHEFLEKVRGGGTGTDPAMRDTYMPTWTADEISDAEVQLMADYIGSL